MLFADFEPFTRIGGYTDTRMPACAAYNVVVPDKLLTTYKPCTAILRLCPFIKFVYPDKFPATYKPCTAIAHKRNKLCTLTAKARHTCLATGITSRLKYRDWWPDGCAR